MYFCKKVNAKALRHNAWVRFVSILLDDHLYAYGNVVMTTSLAATQVELMTLHTGEMYLMDKVSVDIVTKWEKLR